MMEEHLDEQVTGPLVERGFYVKPRKYFELKVMAVMASAFLSFELIILMSWAVGRPVFEVPSWAALLFSFPPLLMGVMLLGELRYVLRLRNGDLDWDLYENGIMTKKWNFFTTQYDGDVRLVESRRHRHKKRLEAHFVRFDRIAKAYLNKDDSHKEECFGLFLRHLNRGSSPNRPYIKDESALRRDMCERYIPAAIFLEGTDGYMPIMPIDKKDIRDLDNFEKHLRRKVKSVE